MRGSGSMKIGPNDPCHCGSGRKYKRCHQPHDLLETLGGERPALRPGVHLIQPAAVAPRQPVPDHIARPEYAHHGKVGVVRGRNLLDTPEKSRAMRRACRAARDILEMLKRAVVPGITTDALDKLCHQGCIDAGGYPSPLNYHGFPKSVCTSINEVICHGIPDARPLAEGDIVNLDVTIYLDGMHGDVSETVGVGVIDAESQRLIDITRRCMLAGIGAVKPGGRIRDIGRAIETLAHQHGYGVVRAFVGHGVGERFHMDPQVPHYYDAAATYEMVPGLTFTVEPMINQGTWKHTVWKDGWTAVTADLKRSAQHEHTVTVTERGVEILTLPEGEGQPFAH
jgi:methionyl aminopeptidase